jgi:hypothetical protein
MKARRITAQDIEVVVARHFDFRRCMVVPNVSWGLFARMEVDLLIVRPSGYCIEVEIKVSGSDIKADTRKGHLHNSNLLRQLWFAVPERLATHSDIPAKAGILSISGDGSYGKELRVTTLRAPRLNPTARKLSNDELNTVGRLAAMRIWTLKHALICARNRREHEASERREKLLVDIATKGTQ